MSNPVGVSQGNGPPAATNPQGLKQCGHVHGGTPNYVGDVSREPDNIGDLGLRDGENRPLNGPIAITGTSTFAALAAGSGECPYVMIECIQGGGLDGGFIPGTNTNDPPVLLSSTMTMAGFGDVVNYVPYDIANGDLGQVGSATITTAILPGYLLRPTALTWHGQDPDNLFNRAVWLASEVAAVTWTMTGYGSGWDVAFDWNVLGYALETDYPTPCPITVRPPALLIVGSARGGPGVRGQLPRRNIHGNVGAGAIAAPPARGSYSIGGLVGLAESVGLHGESAATAGAVAMAESGGNPSVVNHNDGPPPSNDRGLWQINDYFHPDVSDACAFDPQCNARAMKSISSDGTTWTPWATYNNGLHLPYMDAARAAVAAFEGGGGMHAGAGNQGQLTSS